MSSGHPGGFGGFGGSSNGLPDRHLPGEVYIGPDGRIHRTPWDAIDAALGFEDISGTGAGCGQHPDNVSSKPKKSR